MKRSSVSDAPAPVMKQTKVIYIKINVINNFFYMVVNWS